MTAAPHGTETFARCSGQEADPAKVHRVSAGRAARAAAGLFLAGIALVFIAQNSHEVAIEVFWTTFALPLAFVVLAAGLFGVVAGWLVAALRPRREHVATPANVHQLKRRQEAYGADDRGGS